MLYFDLDREKPFSPMRSKRDVLCNMFKMVSYSNWMKYECTLPEGSNYFAYDRELGRAFIGLGSSIHSFAFPLTLELDELAKHVLTKWNSFIIDSQVAALAIAVLAEPVNLYVNMSERVLDVAAELFSDSNVDLNAVIAMLAYLSDLDDGYFRQDQDAEHENGHLHPENHIDLYHADRVSLKLGLPAPLTMKSLRSLISKNEVAYYLRNPSAPLGN